MTKTRKIPTFLQKCQVQLVERESVTKCPPMKWLPSETTNTAYLPLSQLSALTLQTGRLPIFAGPLVLLDSGTVCGCVTLCGAFLWPEFENVV